MYYTEYAVAARTHYESCKAMFEQCFQAENCPKDILYRIYYLCGHVVECAAVYLIYKYYAWERNEKLPSEKWAGTKVHINLLPRYNKRFTRESHMDFYPLTIDNGCVCSCRRTEKNQKPDGAVDYTPLRFGRASPNETSEDYYNVQSHNFQGYVKGIIRGQIPTGVVPYLNDLDTPEYSLAINLLDNWNTDLRYYYEGRESGHYIKDLNKLAVISPVNEESISQLIEVCGQIVALMPPSEQTL